MTWDKPDGEDLKWLARNLRSAYLEPSADERRYSADFWLNEITTDFGPDVASRLAETLSAEAEPYAAIQAVRDKWLEIKRANDKTIDAIATTVEPPREETKHDAKAD